MMAIRQELKTVESWVDGVEIKVKKYLKFVRSVHPSVHPWLYQSLKNEKRNVEKK